MRAALLVLLAGLSACAKTDDDVATCETLCTELVTTCAFDAYPSFDSCLQGCAYDGTLGADLEQEASCIQASECDVFRVLGCQHRFGAEPATDTGTK